MKSIERIKQGRRARLTAEVNFALHGTPVEFKCIYRREEQKNQFLMGWKSVSRIDIDIAIKRAKGTFVGSPKTVTQTISNLRNSI